MEQLPGSDAIFLLMETQTTHAHIGGVIMPGLGLNISVLCYVDRMDFGFTVDPELVPAPWFMAEGIPRALEERKRAAGIDHSAPLRADDA